MNTEFIPFTQQYFLRKIEYTSNICKYWRRLTLVVTASSLFFLWNCSAEKANDDGRITLTFWHSFVSSTHPALEELIDKFEAEYPHIHIREQYVPTGDALVQKLVTAIQSGTAPDISWIHADFIDKLVNAGAIYPIEYFMSGKDSVFRSQLSDFFPPLLQAATFRDTLFALPMEATTLALLYNRELFRKAGLDPDHPPQNWRELHEYALKLTRDNDGDGKTDQYGFYVPVFPASGPLSIWMVLQWSPFVWQAGGRLISEDQKEIRFQRIPGKEALTLWKGLYDAMNLREFSQGHDSGFMSGRLAMIMDGPWNLPMYRRVKNLDWAVTALPAGPVSKATYLAGENLAIFRQSKHPQAAWAFLKWVTRPDIQAEFSIQSGYLPVRQSTLQIEMYKNHLKTDPGLKGFADQLQFALGRERIDKRRVEINQAIARAIEKTCLGGVDVQAALDEAAVKAQHELDRD